MDRPDATGDLRERQSPLEMTPEAFRAAGHALVDEIADFLGSIRDLPVARDETPAELRALLPAGGPPEQGAEPGALLSEARRLLVEHSLFNGHPRFLGYITSSSAPIGALADLLASAVNPNLGGWQLSPIASEIERQSVRWIAELLGFPAADGLLVSGGNVANFSGFLAARRAAGGEDLRRDGVSSGAGRLRAYVSAETHTWIQKAADLFGLGTESVRWIPVDGDLRVDVGAMRERMERDAAAGDRPFLVVGTAGTVATGAVDALDELADLAREHGAWFHVDGAYGAFARMVPDEAARFAGLERADSIAVDPHKWLYAALEAGCVLVRHADALTETFAYTPSYYHFEDEEEETDPRVNFYERGMQNSRGFRALKVWLGLRQAGTEGLRRMVEDDIRLTRELHRLMGETPELEAVTQGLAIATFRHVPEGRASGSEEDEAYLDALNEALLERLKTSGELFLSNAVIGERFLLRACVCNFRTSLEDVEALPGIVLRHGREVVGELGEG